MIKKILLLFLGLFVFMGFSYTHGYTGYVREIGTYGFSPYDNNNDIEVISKGSFLTNRVGTTKDILFLAPGSYFAWVDSPWGFPSLYTYGNRSQGFFQLYGFCDEVVLSGDSITQNQPINCSLSYISSSTSEIFTNFLKTVKQNDLFWFVGSENNGGHGLCISSSELHKSLCFGRCKVSSNYCSFFSNGNSVNPSIYTSGLTGSLSLSSGFDSISRNFLRPSPAVDLGVSEGSTDGKFNNILTGDYLYYDCTWNDVLTALETEGYNEYVCYGGLDDFSLYDSSLTYNPIAGRGLSISQIWAWSGSRAWDNFSQWFTFWNGLYKDTDNNYNSMWESYPAVYYTYFKLYNTFKGSVLDPRTVLEYCQLRELTGDLLNNSAGGYFSPVCETIVREKQTGFWNSRLDGSIYSGGVYTGDVPISVNWNGVGNMSGLQVQSDGIVFLQDFFNLTKTKLTTNGILNFPGILPTYIIAFLLAIILFRFLSH